MAKRTVDTQDRIEALGQGLVDLGYESEWVAFLTLWEEEGSIPEDKASWALNDLKALYDDLGLQLPEA